MSHSRIARLLYSPIVSNVAFHPQEHFGTHLGHMSRIFSGDFRGSGIVLFCFTLAVNLDSPFCRANKLPAGFGTLVSQIHF